MRAPWSQLPALPACVGITAGIIVSDWCNPWLVIVATLAAFATLYALKRHYASFYCLMTAVGSLTNMAASQSPPPDTFFVGRHDFVGKVYSVRETASGMTYLADIDSVDGRPCPRFSINLSVNSVERPLDCGDVFAFYGSLHSTTDTALSPTDTMPRITPLPGFPDYDAMLRRSGIQARAYLAKDNIKLISPATGCTAWLNNIRRSMFNAIVTSDVNGQTTAFLTAVILGDGAYIDVSRRDVYRSSGVAHMLALSGLHVGIIAMLLEILMLPLRWWRRTWVTRRLVVMALIWLYALIVGISPSVIRAAIMISVMLVATMLSRNNNSWNALCLSIAIILAIWPRWLYSPGLQMSVAAVASLMLFTPLIPAEWSRYPLLKFAASAVVVPVAAILGTGIVSVYYLGYLPLYFLPANIVCGILFPFILGGGFVLMLVRLCTLTCVWGARGIDLAMWMMDTSVSWLSELPGARIDSLTVDPWVFLPYTLTLVLLGMALRLRRRYIFILALSAAVVTYTCIYLTPAPSATEAYLINRQSTNLLIVRNNDICHLRNYTNPAADQTIDSTYCAPYLNLRGVKSVKNHETDTISTHIHQAYCSVGKNIVFIADSLASPTIRPVIHANDTTGIRCFWLITNTYRGDIQTLPELIKTDGIIIGADVHPSRRKRWLKQMPESVRVFDLRTIPALQLQ